MKKFLIKLMVLCSLLFFSAPMIIVSTHCLSKRIDWKIPHEKHVLFMGASHFVHAINDSLLPSAINLAKSSERYMFTYIKLQHIIDNNKQIDSVFIMLSPTDLFEHADDKYFKDNEMAYFYAHYFPLFNIEQFLIYKKNISRAFSLLYGKTFFQYLKGVDYNYFCEGYVPKESEMDLNSVYYNPIDGIYGNNINYMYLRKIIKLCNDKNINIFFIYCPVYHPEYFYNQDYYYNAYKNNFSDVKLFDYSHLEMEADEYYDAHHVNRKGALRFTNELKRQFGL